MPERKEQSSKKNLLECPQETIQSMAQIEGPRWMQLQEDIQEGRANPAERNNSVQEALERLASGERTVVYGAYGMNRWYVGEDGSVAFSRSHAASDDALRKARELGFEITS